jgi:hypothetical protein
MKISLALGQRGKISPQTAWGFLTANLAMPGIGSLAGGRLSGYPQCLLSLAGMGMTLYFGSRFILWYIRNWSRLQQLTETEPLQPMFEVWTAVRWALLGMAFFAVAWLWALFTSWRMVSRAKAAAKSPPLL